MSQSPSQEAPSAPVSPSDRFVVDFLRNYWYLLVIVLVFGATFFYWWRFYAFTDQGYAPKQPIAFSHELHAGKHAMDCSYCHFNAERGRHAGVPPASVCLGCHSPDKGGVGAGIEEVEKMVGIFSSEVEDSYTMHELTYFNVEGAPDAPQDAIQKEGGVVHWERIHKLPDHVYFSHEWHVAAGVSCQTCHGPIEEMEVVYQYADLSMGWCIDCHRNDNYVGGPGFDGESMETFTVGVGDYDVIRSRIRPDNAPYFNTEIVEAKEKLAKAKEKRLQRKRPRSKVTSRVTCVAAMIHSLKVSSTLKVSLRLFQPWNISPKPRPRRWNACLPSIQDLPRWRVKICLKPPCVLWRFERAPWFLPQCSYPLPHLPPIGFNKPTSSPFNPVGPKASYDY